MSTRICRAAIGLTSPQRIAELHSWTTQGQASTAETVLRDWVDFVTFYPYPKEHWLHLRTSNPIESNFSGVRLLAEATKRMRQRETALYPVFKVVQRLAQNWRTLNEGENLMTLVLEGWVFEQGVRQRKPAPQRAA